MKLIVKTLREALKTPGFSSLYIVGVAFTIAFTMIYGMLLYGQLGPIYPEYDRSSTMYIDATVTKSERSSSSNGLGIPFIEEFLRDSLSSIEKMTVTSRWNSGYPMVQTDGHGPEFNVQIRKVEPSFFDFYKYEFKAGNSFSQGDFESGRCVAVISDKVSNRLFSSPEEAIGKYISIDHVKYHIDGVVREGSALSVDSYGEVFIPYERYSNGNTVPKKYTGAVKAIIKVKPGKENQLREELRDICRRINSVDTTAARFYLPIVISHAEHVLINPEVDWDSEMKIEEAPSFFDLWKPLIIALLVLLIIPALNISGLIGARMDRMGSEIGVRRCFGAKRPRLMSMILRENLILTLIGGLVGLITAWLIVKFAGSFLLELTPLEYQTQSSFNDSASFVTGEMAFAPLLFAVVLVVCLVLNIISAWVPARILYL
ncbi:MAG: ABC transporter permease, partial [Muribaculaceae bacterium]|nr:ABC transporter permease [Muribaculaceae bacterium]